MEDHGLGALPNKPQLVHFALHIKQVGKYVPLVIISIPQFDQRATTLNRVEAMIRIMKFHTCIVVKQ